MTDSTLDPVLRSRLIEEGAEALMLEDVDYEEGVEMPGKRDWCRGVAAAVVDALGIEEYGTTWDVTPDTPERAYPVYRIAAAEDSPA